MRLGTCSYENEVVRMLKNGHWPEGCEPELRSHVAGCAQCKELIFVTQALQEARSESVQQSPTGSASLLWWRAQMRKRNEAAERINRPITIAQTFAVVDHDAGRSDFRHLAIQSRLTLVGVVVRCKSRPWIPSLFRRDVGLEPHVTGPWLRTSSPAERRGVVPGIGKTVSAQQKI